MTAALPQEYGLTPWSERQVKRTLERWWEMRDSSPVSMKSAMTPGSGRIERVAKEFCGTVAYWVWATDKGLRRMFPDRGWGSGPIVVRWLMDLDIANEAVTASSSAQRVALVEGKLRYPRVRAELDRLWHRAERASNLAHKTESSRAFQLAAGFLGIAFSMCAADDWTWRKLEVEHE